MSDSDDRAREARWEDFEKDVHRINRRRMALARCGEPGSRPVLVCEGCRKEECVCEEEE